MVWKTPIFGCMERMDICCCSCFVGPLFAGTFFLKKMSNIFHSLVWKKINTNFKQKMQNQSVKIRCFGLWQVLLLVERVFFGVWSERSMVLKDPLLWILLATCKSTYHIVTFMQTNVTNFVIISFIISQNRQGKFRDIMSLLCHQPAWCQIGANITLTYQLSLSTTFLTAFEKFHFDTEMNMISSIIS